MSDTTAYLSSTPMEVVHSDNGGDPLQALVDEHFEDGDVFLEEGVENGVVVCYLAMEPSDVSFSFNMRVAQFCEKAAKLVSKPFEVLMRTDAMNDDRDEYFYGGPEGSDVEGFARSQRINRALDCLSHSDVEAIEALRSALAAGAVEGASSDRPRG